MTRALEVVSAEPDVVLAALRDALSGDGPAILPSTSQRAPGLPVEVERKIALVVETSGSTGAPKRVALSSDAVLASAAASETALGGPGQWLLALPAHYIAGINVLVRSITAQTEPVVVAGDGFTAERFVEAANELSAHARFTSLVPAQLARLIDEPGAHDALRRFDRILVGGQSTPPALLDRARELGLKATRTYGSSETSGGCVYDGLPIGNTEIRIADDGRIELSGSVLAEGYLDDPDATARAFPMDGLHRWYRTDDTGALVDGALRVTGRADDVIVSGGVKVSLAAVEAAARSIPGLADAVVVRAPSEQWGEVPVLVTTTDAELESVRSAIADRLGRAAAPARIIVVGEVPVLPSGKPDRVALERLALQ